MFGFPVQFLRACLLVILLNIIGFNDEQNVNGTHQLNMKSAGSHGIHDGLMVQKSTPKRITHSFTQTLRSDDGDQMIVSTSNVQDSVGLFPGGNANVKKKEREKRSIFPLKIVGEVQPIKIERRDIPAEAITLHEGFDPISNQEFGYVRSSEEKIIVQRHNFAYPKWRQLMKSPKGFLQENSNIEIDFPASVINENGRHLEDPEDVLIDRTNNKRDQWQLLTSKNVHISYHNDTQEETISSAIKNSLSSNTLSFAKKIKLTKNRNGSIDMMQTSTLNTTMGEGQRLAPPQIKVNNLLDHIRQHMFNNFVYPVQQWPWHMSVQEEHVGGWHHLCHGAVVSPHTVLTSAECVYRKLLPTLRIVKHNLIEKVVILNNSSYIVARLIHPAYKRYLDRLYEYRATHRPNHPHHIQRNNLALLHLRHRTAIEPIRLDNVDHSVSYDMCYTIDHRPIKLISNRECNYYFSEHIGPSHMCAYGLPCDTLHHYGSPLVCTHPGRLSYLVGLSSYQQGCGRNHVTVYEKIAHATNWIHRNLK